MANINISLRREAYEFLKLLKGKEKSFSDVILNFRTKKSNNIMELFGGLKEANIDWDTKEEKIKAFRDSFNRRMKETRKKMEQSRNDRA